MYPIISSPGSGLQQLAKLTLILSIPSTIISASVFLGIGFNLTSRVSSSSLSIILVMYVGLYLLLPITKYKSSKESSFISSYISFKFSSLKNSEIDSFLFLNSFSRASFPRSI